MKLEVEEFFEFHPFACLIECCGILGGVHLQNSFFQGHEVISLPHLFRDYGWNFRKSRVLEEILYECGDQA